MRQFLMFAMLGMALLSGCLSDDSEPTTTDGDSVSVDESFRPAPESNTVQATAALAGDIAEPVLFTESVVDAAIQFTSDLYEPTMDVSNNGVIYITGHTIGADTTGAPAYYSQDDGATWAQLATVGDVSLPTVHGSSPPPSDEIFIVAGDDGWAFGVDITLVAFPMTFWSDNGETFAYHNPNGYDRVEAAQACSLVSLNDRPWAAYANGTLLVINNPGGGPAQLGVMEVPPALPLGVSNIVNGPTWNTCASPGGSIPGIPDIGDNGIFALPQVNGANLQVVVGHKSNIDAVETKVPFSFTNGGTITSNYGQAAFDMHDDLFIGIANNTFENDTWTGGFKLATSTDDGQTFMDRTFLTAGRVTSFYMDGNMNGEGALLTWAVPGESGTDWYMAHAYVAEDGSPVIENVAVAIAGGPAPSAHVTGAGVGPDGRAYFAMFEAGAIGGTPLSVWIQQSGPTMPMAMQMAVAAVAEA